MGDVCWLEIPATEMARCQAFYKTVFGWEFTTHPNMPEGSYAMFSKPNTKLAGGILAVKEEALMRPKVDSDGKGETTNKIIMRVEEVTAALKSIEAAGGVIVCGKTEIGSDMGYTGLFRDTEGNVNGIWSQK